MIHAQRGEEETSPGYCIGSLVANRCLCSCSDSVGVLNRPASNGATSEMELNYDHLKLTNIHYPSLGSKQLGYGSNCV